MASSMLAGERRWASARKGGMTVLGKVAAPKPLNLPSQRLENHGLDPSVEIVPKGTLSWGSRSSSSASNAWGTSTSSPNADGGTSSPSQLSGRPSSGSGTRPSTAGSDGMREPIPNAWGQSSRPSSASGVLTSNQTALTSLRPRSAETRPGSSHLSRFAEPSPDNSVVWGPTGVSEKLGVATSRGDGFSLSSGDFPTLGSERDNSGKSTDAQGHSSGRPGSSSGRPSSGKEEIVTSSVGDISVNANVNSGTSNAWRRDDSQRVEDGVQATGDKWQGQPPPFLNANVPPQHFGGWHGPQINHPPGVWYRGPPGRPPYGTPLAPGGFPMEQFPYYHPQIPPPALANSQPVPSPCTGPRGHHPKNGDVYRPHIPDSYARPDMPIRPGFYPGPMAYEGYYGPPVGYCNSNERDTPFMGMAAGPTVNNWYPGENSPDFGNSNTRASMHGSRGKTFVSEQVESGHSDDTQGPYKVLLKQHNQRDEKLTEDKRGYAAPANAPNLENGNQPRTSLPKYEWGLEDRKDEELYSGSSFDGDAHSLTFDNRRTSSSDSARVKVPESGRKANISYHSSVNKSENAASTSTEGLQVFPVSSNDPMLIQKIEGLNAKARASDRELDAASTTCNKEPQIRLQVDAMANRSAVAPGATSAVCYQRTRTSGIPSTHEGSMSTADKTFQPAASSGTAFSRINNQGAQGRLDHRDKRFNTRDDDGWRKKPLASEPFSEVSPDSVHVPDHLKSVEAAEKLAINLQRQDEGESLTSMSKASDCQVQMREIAKQRAKQLQEEEEERIREQKAKAFAKLEELNRRTQTMELTQKLEKAPPIPSGPIQQMHEESRIPAEPVTVAGKSEASSSALIASPNAEIRVTSSKILVGEFTVLSNVTPLETSDSVNPESVVSVGQSLSCQLDVRTLGADECTESPQVNEGSVSRHKRMGFRQKQNVPLRKDLTVKSVSITPTEAPKGQTGINVVSSTEVVAGEVSPSSESSLPMNSNTMVDSSPHQRRKNNRSSKNKHKLDDSSSVSALPSAVAKETDAAKVSVESGKSNASDVELDWTLAKHAIQPSELHPSLPSEEATGKVDNQWKSQRSRRLPRYQQASRTSEKSNSSDSVIWAPVLSQKRADVIDEAGDKTVLNNSTEIAKIDNVVPNNVKNKRAEIERYVPKPVAKELAQQVSIPQPVPSLVNQTTPDNSVGRAEPVQDVESSQPGSREVGNIRSGAESRNGDGRQNRHSKSYGSWRQRGLAESGAVQGLPDGSLYTSVKSVEHYQSLKPDMNSDKRKSSDNRNTAEGSNTTETSQAAAVPVTSAVVKDLGVTGGKRNPSKGRRSRVDTHDFNHRNANASDTEKRSLPPPTVVGQTDKDVASKENRGFGERTSHWKPKFQGYSVHNERVNRPSGGQNHLDDVSDPIKNDSYSKDKVPLPQQHKEGRNDMVLPPIDYSFSEQKYVGEAPHVEQQESKRERKGAPFRGRPHLPNVSSGTVELAPVESVDPQHEQSSPSRLQKYRHQNNHFGRGHESREDWSSVGQDNKQHNSSSNWERQRHSSHYEYQVKPNNLEGLTDGTNNTGSRYKERSHGHSRRGGGNIYARQRGQIHTDASYD